MVNQTFTLLLHLDKPNPPGIYYVIATPLLELYQSIPWPADAHFIIHQVKNLVPPHIITGWSS